MPSKYVIANKNPMPTVLTADALTSSQKMTPKTCGAEINGMRSKWPLGLQPLSCHDQKTEFLETAYKLVEVETVRSVSRITIAIDARWPSPYLPQARKTQGGRRALTPVTLLMRIIADQTSKWPSVYAPPSPKISFPLENLTP